MYLIVCVRVCCFCWLWNYRKWNSNWCYYSNVLFPHPFHSHRWRHPCIRLFDQHFPINFRSTHLYNAKSISIKWRCNRYDCKYATSSTYLEYIPIFHLWKRKWFSYYIKEYHSFMYIFRFSKENVETLVGW